MDSEESSPTWVMVVIPYYQRAEGLLAEALESVFAQSTIEQGLRLDLLVVDDHSPRDPAMDVEQVSVPENVKLTMLRTAVNGGPAAARNCGLGAVPAGVTHVAFLDSDEVWTPLHLENALRAFELSQAGIYFANYTRSEWQRDKFAVTGFGKGHALLCQDKGIYSFSGDPLNDILFNATVRIQTCVVRWSQMSAFRFRRELAIGEDSDYVANAVTEAGVGMCFCMDVETIAMRSGVNVSQNIHRDPPKELLIRFEMLRYQSYVLKTYSVRPGIGELAQEALLEARYNFLQAVADGALSVAAKARGLGRATIADAGFLPWCVAFLSRVLWRRLTGKSPQ